MGQELTAGYFAENISPTFVSPSYPVGVVADRPRPRRPRPALSFRSVNLPDRPGYDAGLQRHHLLPRQLLAKRCFGALFDAIGHEWPGFNDFRSNGMLLPCNAAGALRLGLPLHRGPHRDYNAMVIERVGQVEARWSGVRLRTPRTAHREALAHIESLQHDLRCGLLDPGRKRLALNRHDPLDQIVDFAHLDAMADALWPSTDPGPAAPNPRTIDRRP